MRLRTRVITLASAVSLILILSTAYYWPVQDEYHPLNEEWNGCSKLVNAAPNSTLVVSYSEALPERTLLAIIGPSLDFSQKEASYIRAFLESGGTVLLADDIGTGNSLLKALAVPARFSGKSIEDLLYYSKRPDFPLITDFSASAVTDNVTAVLMSRPSYVQVKNSSVLTVVASSSTFSFVDENGDRQPGANETLQSYPVMASVRIERGLLVLVSDPSVFVNEMVDLYDNMRLFQNILRIGGGSIAFDVAHLARASLTDLRTELRSGIDSIRSSLLLSSWGVYTQSLIVAAVVLALFLHIRRNARIRAPGKKSQAFYTDSGSAAPSKAEIPQHGSKETGSRGSSNHHSQHCLRVPEDRSRQDGPDRRSCRCSPFGGPCPPRGGARRGEDHDR